MTQLEIVNGALARLGVDPIGNINDTTKAAKNARLFWQNARDTVLRTDNWNSARASLVGVNIADIPWVSGKAYAAGDYSATSSQLLRCTKPGTSGTVAPSGTAAAIVDGTATWEPMDFIPVYFMGYANAIMYPDDCVKVVSVGTENDYRVLGRFIYCGEANPVIEYVRAVTNPETLDAHVQDLIRAKLAILLAPAFGQSALVAQLTTEYLLAVQEAKASSSDEAQNAPEEEKLWTENV